MANYTQFTLQDLEDIVTARAAGTTVFWTEQEKKDAINEAICVWQAMAGEWSGKQLQTALGNVYYTVPKQLDQLFRVSYVSSIIGSPTTATPLVETVAEELDLGSPGWQSDVGTPTYWGPLGVNFYFVTPAPSTGYLVLEGYTEPPRLILPGDFIDLGDEELLQVTQYAQHYLALKEGSQEFASAETDMQSFMKAAGLRNNRLKASALYKEFMGQPKDERIHPTRQPTGEGR